MNDLPTAPGEYPRPGTPLVPPTLHRRVDIEIPDDIRSLWPACPRLANDLKDEAWEHLGRDAMYDVAHLVANAVTKMGNKRSIKLPSHDWSDAERFLEHEDPRVRHIARRNFETNGCPQTIQELLKTRNISPFSALKYISALDDYRKNPTITKAGSSRNQRYRDLFRPIMQVSEVEWSPYLRLTVIVAKLNARQRYVFDRRMIRNEQTPSLADIGREMGISHVSAYHIEMEARNKIKYAMENSHSIALVATMQNFEQMAGLSIDIEHARILVAKLLNIPEGEIPNNRCIDTFLSFAKYAHRHGDYIMQGPIKNIDERLKRSCANIEHVKNKSEEEAYADVARIVGIPTHLACERLREFGYRFIDNHIVSQQISTEMRIHQALERTQRPMTITEIANASGNKEFTEIQIARVLNENMGFTRVARRTYAPATWELDSFDGIVHEIAKRFERDGAIPSFTNLCREFEVTFKVTRSSIREAASHGQFLINSDGSVSQTISRKLRSLQKYTDTLDTPKTVFRDEKKSPADIQNTNGSEHRDSVQKSIIETVPKKSIKRSSERNRYPQSDKPLVPSSLRNFVSVRIPKKIRRTWMGCPELARDLRGAAWAHLTPENMHKIYDLVAIQMTEVIQKRDIALHDYDKIDIRVFLGGIASHLRKIIRRDVITGKIPRTMRELLALKGNNMRLAIGYVSALDAYLEGDNQYAQARQPDTALLQITKPEITEHRRYSPIADDAFASQLHLRIAIFLAKMHPNMRTVFMARLILSESRPTLERVRTLINMTGERARQLEVLGTDELQKMLHTSDGIMLSLAAEKFSKEFGPAIDRETARHVASEILNVPHGARLRDHCLDIFLFIANFTHRHGSYPTKLPIAEIDNSIFTACTKLQTLGNEYTNEWMTRLSENLQIPKSLVAERLARAAYHEVGKRIYIGDVTITTLMEATLAAHEKPMTTDAIIRAANIPNRSKSSARNALIANSTFVRVGKQTYALSSWNPETFTSVRTEFLKAISAGNGLANLDDIIRDFPSRFNVSQETVINAAYDKAFTITRNRMIRLRKTEDQTRLQVSTEELQTAKDFFLIDGSWYLRRHLTASMIAGKPWAFPNAVATIMKMRDGSTQKILVAGHTLKFTNYRQPKCFSLGPLVENLKLVEGDYFFFEVTALETRRVFRIAHESIDASQGLERVARLSGYASMSNDEETLLRYVASALSIDAGQSEIRERIRTAFRMRKDENAVALMEPTNQKTISTK